MTTSKEKLDFKFPTWKEFSDMNNKFLRERKYDGYELSIPFVHNLHILLDCQNESCIYPNGEDVIRFAWCTNNGFAIYSKRYIYCEAGYLKGCADLISAAHEFSKFFEDFKMQTAFDLQSRINKYESEHPEVV